MDILVLYSRCLCVGGKADCTIEYELHVQRLALMGSISCRLRTTIMSDLIASVRTGPAITSIRLEQMALP